MSKPKLDMFDGVEFEHDGNTAINWVVTTSADKETYATAFFDSFDAARDYARIFVSQNQGSPVTVVAEAVVQVNTGDFLDEAKWPHQIGIMPNLWLESVIKDQQ